MQYKKGKSFKFKPKLIKDKKYPDDTLYFVGKFTSEKDERLLVLDGVSEEVVIVPEDDVTPVEESEHQEKMNVLVDAVQMLKLIYSKVEHITQHIHGADSDHEDDEETDDEDSPRPAKRKPEEMN